MKHLRSRLSFQILIGLLGAALLGLLLPFADGHGLTFRAWSAYFTLSAPSIVVFLIVWSALRKNLNAPTWLVAVVFTAWLLRLGVGFALNRALPDYGNGEKAERAERAGYVYWDAYKRDTDAYDRARGDLPLIAAFTDPKVSDQYGGMIFTSAWIYRYLDTGQHRPTLPVTLFSALGALSVLFTWGFARNVFDERVAGMAAWVVALYPEAVLLSASQMREPFLMTGFAMGLFGYSQLRSEREKSGSFWLAISALMLILPISPPFLVPFILMLLGLWFWETRRLPKAFWIVAPLIALLLLAAGIFVAQSWAGLEAIGGTPIQVITSWLDNLTAQWRVTQVASQSDWMDTITDFLPGSLQVPFLVLFGLVQPFLPAALAAPGAPVWKALAIWRSLGWFAMLPLLIFATFWSLRRDVWKSTTFLLVLFIWMSALFASYRAPGYQWDNPRYRAVLISIQAVIIAWGWVAAKRSNTRLLRHVLILFGGSTLIFTYWYLGRYTGLPEIGLLTNFGLIAGFAIIYIVAVYARYQIRAKSGSSIK
ncbi:MAG: hypothetical protein P1P76_02280 [Anaerolineales bacterium]|nr:hypothetical protein [Anaerolineales bacterium]